MINFAHVVAMLMLACFARPTSPPAASPRQLHVPSLMYHYISANPAWPNDTVRTNLSVPPPTFAAQLEYLQHAGYTTISLGDMVSALNGGATLPDKPIVLTFDDGYQDFYDNAYPLLKHYGDHATIYIISHDVDRPGYMTWDELRELATSPLITIGAHTRTHPDLSRLKVVDSWDEMAGSKTDLENQLGIVVRDIAYPSGRYSPTVLDQAGEIGFATGVTTREGQDETPGALLALPRIRVNGYTSIDDLIAGLQGRRSLHARRYRRPAPPLLGGMRARLALGN